MEKNCKLQEKVAVMDDNIEGVSYHEGCFDDNEDETYVQNLLQGMGFDSEKDFVNVDPSLLTAELVMTFHFSNLEMAYNFYNWPETRTGCRAKMKVRLDGISGRWRVSKQRVMQGSDVKGAFQYLRDRGSAEGPIFWSHTLDSEGRLMRLFWCDGHSQVDYKVFGDVLAFDATYKTNKYHFPLVVFSGINHHNQTTIFASAVIADETEETYVWLLEQLMVAMKGKAPLSVITDGDLAMKNAIKRVFPNAHHRLCAWHLLRNANTNVKNPRFLAVFKKCMLGDYEIYEFQHRWVKVVTKCGLEENTWVKDAYERRSMWATCYIRDFLQNFHHCLEYFRYKEIEADYASLVGQPVLRTNLHALERSTSRLFTREIFKLIRPALAKGVMVHLNMDEIPGCLVLDRWTMAVKENLYQLCEKYDLKRQPGHPLTCLWQSTQEE
ncbi:MULE transposase domain [Sesbania bispinosa]|nr:MULE transposase domain [Sesbania bispinosa]